MAVTAAGTIPRTVTPRAASGAPGARNGSAWKRRHRWGGSRPSGNVAFDEYREETLRKLDEEQREFRDYLDRLRSAKDRAEFDQFMNERRNRPPATEPPPAALTPSPSLREPARDASPSRAVSFSAQ